MTVAFWNEFLRSWDQEREHILSLLPPDQANLQSIKEMRLAHAFAAPASSNEIAETELRVGCPLPPDLRSFYQVSNGWLFVGMGDMALVSSSRLDPIPRDPIDYIQDVDEYFSIDNDDFISRHSRSTALLLSNQSNTGFCVANPKRTGDWEYACVEFGARSERSTNFVGFMESAKWYCLHYLRSRLD